MIKTDFFVDNENGILCVLIIMPTCKHKTYLHAYENRNICVIMPPDLALRLTLSSLKQSLSRT